MKSLSSHRLPQLLLALVLAIFLLVPSVAAAQTAVTVLLDPTNNSGVSGTVKLTANGDGTDAVLELKGLKPNADVIANLYSNTCALPSASFASLATFTADANGNAQGAGPVQFRGTNMALADISGGENIIGINSGGEMVACGAIPKAGSPATVIPSTGGAFDSNLFAIVGVLGFLTLFAGLILRKTNNLKGE